MPSKLHSNTALVPARERLNVDRTASLIDVFDSRLGWFGLQHNGRIIERIRFGLSSRDDVLKSFQSMGPCCEQSSAPELRWKSTIRAYAAGEPAEFSNWEIETEWMTPFQKRVIAACRRVAAGTTATYGRIAQSVGSPGAARAVGSVMRSNRFPIVVPCHRVVSANGIGGFSASAGVATKRRLLDLENSGQLTQQTRILFD